MGVGAAMGAGGRKERMVKAIQTPPVRRGVAILFSGFDKRGGSEEGVARWVA